MTGLFSDTLGIDLTDSIDNTAGYGIREKKKQPSSKKIAASMMGQSQPSPISLEPHEFTSAEHGDMSVAQTPETGMSEEPVVEYDDAPTAIEYDDVPRGLLSTMGLEPEPVKERTGIGSGLQYDEAKSFLTKGIPAIKDYLAELVLRPPPKQLKEMQDEAVRQKELYLQTDAQYTDEELEDPLGFLKGADLSAGQTESQKSLRALGGDLKHAYKTAVGGAALEGGAFLLAKMLKRKTPAAILAAATVNTVRHAFTDKDLDDNQKSHVSYIARQIANMTSPEFYEKITEDKWYSYEELHDMVATRKLSPEEATKIKQTQSVITTAAKNEAVNFVQTLTMLGTEGMAGVGDMIASAYTAADASNTEDPEKAEDLKEKAWTLLQIGAKRFSDAPMLFFTGGGALMAETALAPFETMEQAPIGAFAVGGVGYGRAAENLRYRGEAGVRVAKEHGVLAGAKTAITLNDAMLKAMRKEIRTETSAVGKAHKAFSAIVNRFGLTAEQIHQILQLYYRVEETAPGAEAIFKREARDTAARWQKWQDDWGALHNKMPQETIALMHRILSEGESSAHLAAFLMHQMKNVRRSGGDAVATKLLQSKKAAAAEATAAAESLYRTVDEGKAELQAEHLEEAAKVRDEFKALALEDAVREAEGAANFEGGDAHLKRVTDEFRELALENLEKPWRHKELGPLEVEPVAPGKMVHIKSHSGPNNVPPGERFSIQEYEVVEVLSDGTGYLIDVTNRDKPLARELWKDDSGRHDGMLSGWRHPLRNLEDGRQLMLIPYGTVAVDPGGESLMMDVSREMDYYDRVNETEQTTGQRTPFKLSNEERKKAELLVDEFMEDPQTKSELAATAREWVDPGGERQTFLDKQGEELRIANEKEKGLTNEYVEGYKDARSTFDKLLETDVIQQNPKHLDRMFKLAESRRFNDPERLKPRGKIVDIEGLDGPTFTTVDPLTKEALPNTKSYADREISQRFTDMYDAMEAAYGMPIEGGEMPHQRSTLAGASKGQRYDVAPGKTRKERAKHVHENLAEWIEKMNHQVPVIWTYKGKPMNTVQHLLSGDFINDVKAGEFKAENIEADFNPDFVSDELAEALIAKKYLPQILAWRRETARQGYEMYKLHVGPDGETGHGLETLIAGMFNYMPAMKDYDAKVKIRVDKEGRKEFDKPYTDEELLDIKLRESLGGEGDATVGLDVGRASSSLPKKTLRHLTGEEGKAAGYLVGDLALAGLTKSKRKVDEVHAQYKKLQDYRERFDRGTFKDSKSLIHHDHMMLLNEVWKELPKDKDGLITMETLATVDGEIVDAIADKLTKVAQQKKNRLIGRTEVTPEEVWSNVNYLTEDATGFKFFSKFRPEVAFLRIPRKVVPGMGKQGWHRYGAMSGIWVPRPQFHHLTSWKEHPMEKFMRSPTAKAFREINNAWKGMHTIAVPGFYFNLLLGTLELNLKDGVMPLGPKSTSAALAKSVRAMMWDGNGLPVDKGELGEAYRVGRDHGVWPEAAFGLEYNSKINSRIIREALNTFAGRLERGDSAATALKKAMIQLGKNAAGYEIPEGQRNAFMSRWKEAKEAANLEHLATTKPHAQIRFMQALGLLKDTVVVTGDMLTGFGVLGEFATRLDHAFKTASLNRRIVAEAKSRPGSYAKNRRDVLADKELTLELAEAAADVNVSYLDLPRLSSWLGPTGFAPFFNYMASAGKRAMAYPSTNPYQFAMYTGGMRAWKAVMFGGQDAESEIASREESNRSVARLMQIVPNEVWAEIPAILSGQDTIGNIGESLPGEAASGQVMRFTYTSPFSLDMLRYMFGLQGEMRVGQSLKGGATVTQPLAGIMATLMHAAQSKGPFGEDLIGYDVYDTFRKKAGFVAKSTLPGYVHWLGDARERALVNGGPERGFDPRSKMTIQEIEKAAMGIPIRGARWIRNKMNLLTDAFHQQINEVKKSTMSDEEKMETIATIRENFFKYQTPWTVGAY